jgi:hypothetical protein
MKTNSSVGTKYIAPTGLLKCFVLFYEYYIPLGLKIICSSVNARPVKGVLQWGKKLIKLSLPNHISLVSKYSKEFLERHSWF